MPDRKTLDRKTLAPHRRQLLAGAAATALMPFGVRAQQPAPKPTTQPEPRALVASPGKATPKAGSETAIWAFDGKSEPPVLRVGFGEPVRIKLDNKTDKPLSLHWHGVRNKNAMDGVGGVTQPPVVPGGTFTYEFTPPDPGTSLIRPLVVGGSSEPAGRGLTGMLVVAEKTPPAIDQDVSLVVQDWRLDDSGAEAPFGQIEAASTYGRLGGVVTVNGSPVPQAIEARPGARLRLRLANACSARVMRIRFDGAKAFVMAIDGQPTDTFEPLRATLPFAPGARYDIILDLPREAGATVSVVALIADGMQLAVLTAKGDPLEARPTVTALGENRLLPPEIKLQKAFRRELTLTGGATFDKKKPDAAPSYSGDPIKVWQINGASGAVSNPPLFSVKRGQVVVLSIKNETDFLQVLHVHGHVFRLLHALDDGWEPYWLDTVQITERRRAQIAFVADNPGKWLISSSVLERFDTGLWGVFEVK